ncbi:MAG: hypothetical protein JEY94_05615 [Melioribacteraceae bacterium]|nr:hypothetical protein [Melioribacteraceae bacterium]
MQRNESLIKRNFLKSLLPLLFLICVTETFGQLQSIEPYMSYSTVMSKRLDLKDAAAVGGGVKLKFNLYNNLSIGVNAGYSLYTIHQNDAIDKWGWFFWDARYKNTIQSNLNAFPELSAKIGNIQKMDLIPVLIDLNYNIDISDKFTVAPVIGGGIYFYTRRFYITESWTKSFEEIDYQFSYNYRNIAPVKKGNPLVFFGGLLINYKIFENFHLKTEINYVYIAETNGLGYNNFPYSDELTVKFGINIQY